MERQGAWVGLQHFGCMDLESGVSAGSMAIENLGRFAGGSLAAFVWLEYFV